MSGAEVGAAVAACNVEVVAAAPVQHAGAVTDSEVAIAGNGTLKKERRSNMDFRRRVMRRMQRSARELEKDKVTGAGGFEFGHQVVLPVPVEVSGWGVVAGQQCVPKMLQATDQTSENTLRNTRIVEQMAVVLPMIQGLSE